MHMTYVCCATHNRATMSVTTKRLDMSSAVQHCSTAALTCTSPTCCSRSPPAAHPVHLLLTQSTCCSPSPPAVLQRRQGIDRYALPRYDLNHQPPAPDADTVATIVSDIMAQIDPQSCFDCHRLAKAICEGKFVDGIGRCQSGKTGFVLVSALTAWLLGRPCVVILAHTVKNSRELAEKVNTKLQLACSLPLVQNLLAQQQQGGQGLGGLGQYRLHAFDAIDVPASAHGRHHPDLRVQDVATGRSSVVASWNLYRIGKVGAWSC
jgi:hypothetical protein